MDRGGTHQKRPVSEELKDRRSTVIFVLIIIIILVAIIFISYILFFRGGSTTRDDIVAGTPCTSISDCATDQLCVSGSCLEIGCSVTESPTNLIATQPSNSTVNLSWTQAIGAVSYRVYVGIVSGFDIFQAIDIFPSIGTAKSLPLPNNITWYFIVTAVNECGESQPSSQTDLTTEFIWPTIPFILYREPGTGIPGVTSQQTGLQHGFGGFSDIFHTNQCQLDGDGEGTGPSTCFWYYNPATKYIHANDPTLTNDCLLVPFAGNIQPVIIGDCVSPINNDTRRWVYNENLNALCLDSNPNLCVWVQFNGAPELRVSDGSELQRFVPIGLDAGLF